MRNNAIVQIGRGSLAARFGPALPLALIAGPCQLESRGHALEMAQALKEIAGRRAIGLVFKSSFDKANRTSGSAARGMGLKAALPIVAEIGDTFLRNNAIVQIGRGPLAARFGPALPLALIAGPCQLESRAHALEMAQALKEIAGRRAIGLVFKSSFDKANRTSGSGQRGVGLKAALPIFAEIRETLGFPSSPTCTRAANAGRSRKRSMRCRSQPSCAARPIFWSPRPRPGARSTSRRVSFLRPGT